jgi:uncharacterized protein YndB with AHSA1/START domain
MSAEKENQSEKELSITRTIDAPLSQVWDAWTDEKQLALWWGPTGFTNPVCEWKPQPGNKILIHMRAPDGALYPMDGEFKEIVKNEKIVFTSAALANNGGHLFEILNTIDFSEESGKTKIEMHFTFYNIKPEGLPHIGGAEIGWNMSLDRLAANTDRHPFVIERTFHAPIATVWKAISDREQMKLWYFDMDGFRPEVGAEFTFTGQKDGVKKIHLCQIIEVIKNKKISYSWRYEGHEGNSLVSFELFEEEDKTRLKLTHTGLETFTVFAKHNFVAGWSHIIGVSLAAFLSKK